MKKFDIVALGELLIDYTPLLDSEHGMKVFEQNAGGAPANVLACATKFGAETAFIGKVGKDMQGDFLKDTLVQAGVDTRGIVSSPEYFTTLAFVSLSENGERNFAFSRKYSADIMLEKNEVDTNILDNAKIFHFGSLSLTNEKCREATIFALEYLKDKDTVISFDPNYRNLLWESEEKASEAIKSVLSYVDVIKISDEECYLVTGEKDPVLAAKILSSSGIKVVCVTLGAEGALVSTNSMIETVKGFKAKEVVDTTGAGDSFWGSFLYKIVESNKKLEEIKDYKDFVKFSNATASLCVERRGAIKAMPTLSEVNNRIDEKK